jgi:hypothetical protein
MQIHSDSNTKKCHYFNNDKSCPYQEVGCMFLHQASEACYFDSNCRNKLCPYQHKSLEKNLDQISQKNYAGKVSENTQNKMKNNDKETVQSIILKAFEKDAEEHYGVNNDCGLNNASQKCNRCKYITHSIAL